MDNTKNIHTCKKCGGKDGVLRHVKDINSLDFYLHGKGVYELYCRDCNSKIEMTKEIHDKIFGEWK